MSRLIDADALLDGYKHMGYNPAEHPEESHMEGWCKGFNAAVDHCMHHVIHAPTIEPERKKGRWLFEDWTKSRGGHMTLDDAINYYDGIAKEYRANADIERNDYMDLRDGAFEAEQLASWLNELKLLRERIEKQPEPCEYYALCRKEGRMSVLIKDMEMPETCDDCPFHVYHSHYEYVCIATPLFYPMNLANSKGIRKDWCPLTELSEPYREEGGE